jgi:hypothetical protein
MMNVLTIVIAYSIHLCTHTHTLSQHTGKEGQKRLAEAKQRDENGNATAKDKTRLDNEKKRSKYLVHVCFSCW